MLLIALFHKYIIAQGVNPNSMTISWLTNDDCFSHVTYGVNNKSLDNLVYGSSFNQYRDIYQLLLLLLFF